MNRAVTVNTDKDGGPEQREAGASDERANGVARWRTVHGGQAAVVGPRLPATLPARNQPIGDVVGLGHLVNAP